MRGLIATQNSLDRQPCEFLVSIYFAGDVSDHPRMRQDQAHAARVYAEYEEQEKQKELTVCPCDQTGVLSTASPFPETTHTTTPCQGWECLLTVYE